MTEPLVLDRLESFYIGGERRATSGSLGPETQHFGQMYVQRMIPADRRFPLPVLFVHGGMHSGVTWETTPDGREGWQTLFVRGGFETLVIDQPWRGRSAPDLTALDPKAPEGTPLPQAVYAGAALAERFARGGGRFDPGWIDRYCAQLWPDFYVPHAIAAGVGGRSDPAALPPMLELVDRLGPVVLVTHSQGGDIGWKTAIARPDRVAAILTIEPALTSPGLDDPAFPAIPVRIMWGDNLPETARTLSRQDVGIARRIGAANPRVTLDLLEEHGIRGNGHMLMMEDNSDLLAQRAMDWFRSLGL